MVADFLYRKTLPRSVFSQVRVEISTESYSNFGLRRRGVPAYVLPGGALPRPARYLPHIYTDQELAALFAQTDRCHYDSQVPFRHLVMPVLFRTIYACGLRASEARLLRFGDVDVETGVLTIRDGKGGKDRQVPVSAPLRERLADYHARIAGRTGGDWFFPGRKGLPLTLMNINRNFRRFLWQARIPHGGRGHGPRVHDPCCMTLPERDVWQGSAARLLGCGARGW